MKDQFVTCERCTSSLCYQNTDDEGIVYHFCMSCGFHSDSTKHKDKINYNEVEEVLPELYKEIRYVDDDGYLWYPTTINDFEKGMVFANGTNSVDWKWCAALAIDKKIDMSTAKHFDQKEYSQALDYINYI